MAVYHDSKCRRCRREGMKLFLKGERCLSDKCAFERRGYPPGEHGQGRRIKVTGYGLQLREKQKARTYYGVLERQFRKYFADAESSRGVTGEVLLQILETRLDNVTFRMGFTLSRAAARQLVRHRHFTVNGRVVDIPSYTVRPGDVITVRESSRQVPAIVQAVEKAKGRSSVPDWLSLDAEKYTGRLLQKPSRDGVSLPIQEQLIVELYSK
jgi:small subunit ribosomal protein S4